MSWNTILFEPVRTMLTNIGTFVTTLIVVILILVVGWLIAKLIKNLVARLFKLIRLDSISESAGIDKVLARGGITYSLSELIGILIYWIALLIVFVVVINYLGLAVAADLLNQIVLYIPKVIAAIFILVLGMFLATFLASTVQTAAANAGIEYSKVLAKITQIVISVFAIAIALEQLQIGTAVVIFAINIILISIGAAIALAFGLGCKDIAGKFIKDLIDRLKR